MKNHREFLGVIANVFLVAIVLLIIVIGLNKIGVYPLPAWAERLIGTSDKSMVIGSEDDFEIYNALKADGNDKKLNSVGITFDNADVILKNLGPVQNYSQIIHIESIYGKYKVNETVSIFVNDSLYTATILNSHGVQTRQLVEGIDSITITDYIDGRAIEAEYQKGSFSVYEECGFILDVDNFLASNFKLNDATFVLTENEKFGSLMIVSFESCYESLKQVEQYTVSLDYGVVVSAFCYEGDNLIYSMTTSELNVV